MPNLSEIRTLIEASVGALTRDRARDLARSMSDPNRGEQVNRLATELYGLSERSREWLRETVGQEVKRQLTSLGIATREDVDALRKRVRQLESGSKSGSSGRSASSRRTSAKRSTASTARSAGSGGRPAKKSTRSRTKRSSTRRAKS